MQAWRLLFTSDVGLFTVVGFLIMFGMAGYFFWLFNFKKDAPPAQQRPGQQDLVHKDA
jgi:flagellar basal body-associated protein FliL